MDARIKQKWIEALRSGQFTQARGALVEDGSYCCLGVLCAVQNADFNQFMELETTELAGESALEAEESYDYSAGLPDSIANALADMNDGRGCEPRSFDHIAGYIYAMVPEDLT
jgi:hypothetical protein